MKLAAEQAVAREAGDLLGGAVDEEDAAGVVEHDHAVGAGLEVVLVLLEPRSRRSAS